MKFLGFLVHCGQLKTIVIHFKGYFGRYEKFIAANSPLNEDFTLV